MTEELSVLFEVAEKLETAGLDYMLTGSMASNLYAMPRMTRDIDFVVAISQSNIAQLPRLFPEDSYYLSEEAAKAATKDFSCFNLIHLATMIKIDIMVRKPQEYRLHEFSRRQKHNIQDRSIWVVSKEDLILSKLAWAKDSLSEKQLGDVKNLLATGCDINYLQTWAKQLQLTDILTQVSA
ncbi:MAG: nucleotidyl transferase AbiEii/AbiGii toxin family protein [Akkermansiaceae bacterium]|nr:nucleotidyl transferase AbiEii/AbiGii toxin family protein [Akkermansiaceae bacterium]